MVENFRPLSRTARLLTEQLDDELLVYDPDGPFAIRLNRTAALVWRSADGERSVADLVEVVRLEVELADEDLVMVALDHLHENGLIEAGYRARTADDMRLSRRRFIRRVGVVGSAALALPVVTSVVAPSAAAAQSAGGGGCACYCPCYCGACGSCYCEPCDPGPPGPGGCLACQSCSCSTCSCAGPCSTCGTCGGSCACPCPCPCPCSCTCSCTGLAAPHNQGSGNYHW